MAEYIEKDKAINAVFEAFADGRSAYIALEAIPAADVVPVRHGRWIKPTRVPDSMLDECSLCGFDCGAYTFNYCPNCGALMDKGGEA